MQKKKKILLKSCIPGFEKLIEADIPDNSINLITGAPGTLKTSFVLSLMSNYSAKTKSFGLYLSLEEPMESCLRNLESIGIKKPDNLQILDFRSIRKKYKETEKSLDIVKITERIVEFYKREKGEKFSLFGLDSLNAFSSFALEPTRRGYYHFFTMLKESNLVSFVTMESQSLNSLKEYTPEYFLADGIFELGILERPEGVTRYLQIKKIRSTAHSMKKHRVSITRDAIAILGPVYV